MAAVTYYLNGELYRIHGTSELSIADIISSSVPADAQNIQEHDDLIYPEDTLFIAAWQLQDSTIVEDPAAAKVIAHNIRRQVRDSEFTPWDRKVTIPSEAVAAEAEREAIRLKHAQLQTDIDNATDIATLRTVVKSFI